MLLGIYPKEIIGQTYKIYKDVYYRSIVYNSERWKQPPKISITGDWPSFLKLTVPRHIFSIWKDSNKIVLKRK